MSTIQPQPGHNRFLADKAYRIRRTALQMGQVQGQGYIAQALDVADVLAVAYFHAMNIRPQEPEWEGRDRFYLSIGHYAPLPMSGMAQYTPGMEITGGSLGHGLPIAVGACLGLKRKKSEAFVYNLLSDGELGEGSTWEAAMSAAHWKLDNLIALVDVNDQQADGPSSSVLSAEPLSDKFRAFGWFTQRVNGNDLDAVVEAFDAARAHTGAQPRVIICDTLMGKGVKFLEARDKNHFIRVDEDEWDKAIASLDAEFAA